MDNIDELGWGCKQEMTQTHEILHICSRFGLALRVDAALERKQEVKRKYEVREVLCSSANRRKGGQQASQMYVSQYIVQIHVNL